MKIRFLRVLWVAMILWFFLLSFVTVSQGEIAGLLIGALVSGIGLSIIYIITGSFAFPKTTDHRDQK